MKKRTATDDASGVKRAPKAAPDEAKASHPRLPARFSHLYESRDGALCLFEDEFGHLHAVDSSRLA